METKKCKFVEKLDKILNKASNYFFVPFLLIFGLTLLRHYCQHTQIRLVVDIVMTVIFFVEIGIAIYKLCRKLTQLAIIWPLIVSLVALTASLITSFANEVSASNFLFIIGIIFMEVFLIYLIICDVYDKNNRLSRAIISSTLFVILGYITIYYASFDSTDPTLFNSLIAVFSAVVGGGLTLGGVAWTIKHEKEEKRREEIQKSKPYFAFNMLKKKPQNIDGEKLCFPKYLELEYEMEVYAEIENSNQSVVELQSVCHDGKWFDLQLNNVLIHSGKAILNFRFSNPNDIYLSVEDVLGNSYYYKVEVFYTGLIKGGEGGNVHTIRGINEISREELDGVIKKQQK